MRIRNIPKDKQVKPGASYQMPKICACCLEPTKYIKTVKDSAGAGYKRIQTFKWRYPLCKECKKHQSKWKWWSIWAILLLFLPVGFLTKIIFSSEDAVIFNWFLMVTVVLIVHGILIMIWLKKNPIHTTAFTDPVVADWVESKYDYNIIYPTFWFKNPDFEKAFIELND